jgi:5-hydroxyisourate hydrolase
MLAIRVTNSDGRCLDLLPVKGSEEEKKESTALAAGNTYKIVFFTEPYFESSGRKSFYPQVEVCYESKHQDISLTALR